MKAMMTFQDLEIVLTDRIHCTFAPGALAGKTPDQIIDGVTIIVRDYYLRHVDVAELRDAVRQALEQGNVFK